MCLFLYLLLELCFKSLNGLELLRVPSLQLTGLGEFLHFHIPLQLLHLHSVQCIDKTITGIIVDYIDSD